MQLHFDPDVYEGKARGLLAEHHERTDWARRAVAAYVPRVYGLSLEEVSAGVLTADEARLAIARIMGAPSWEVLIDRLDAASVTRKHDSEDDPMRHARGAMVDADLDALQRVVKARPELIHPCTEDAATGHTLMGLALWQERIRGADAMRPIMEWLATQGLDRQRALNNRLCGHVHMTPEEVRSLLDQGADANWVAPNGLSVLEHALICYWSGGDRPKMEYLKVRRSFTADQPGR
jgi:hypothetical protein